MTERLTMSVRRAGLELVVASFVVLFQELALIRWLPTQVRVTAYFPNLILIGAFLGLGIGSLRARNRSLLWLWPVSLIVLVGAGIAMGQVAFTASGVSEQLWLLYNDLGPDAPVVDGVRVPIVLSFVLGSLTFVPLGQIVARRLNVFRDESSPLWGYAMDLSGSLLGVVGFAFVSFSGAFPVVWFLIFTLLGGVLFLDRRRLLALHLVAVVVLAVAVSRGERNQIYSPYYALSSELVETTDDYRIRTNGSLHQVAVAVRNSDPLITIQQEKIREGYHLPYGHLDGPLEKVLVLGAGTGNDVAVALEEGALEVHAVEIDPAIIQLGRELHPDDPYADPRVRVINEDARSYLNHTEERYDLVVFGTLDSQTQLSALSTVRLDNFVYTREAIRAAAATLKPDGGMVLLFSVGREHISDHLTLILTTVFGHPPVLTRSDWHMFNHLYMVGPAFAHLRPPGSAGSGVAVEELALLDMPSDDWPYLYLPEPGVTGFYYSLMLIFAVLALAGLLAASPGMRHGLRTGKGIDVEMFLFGLAFLLIETRFVTAINLVWGATWITSAVVFGSILFMILLSTVVMELRPIPWRVASWGLIASLLVTYLTPTHLLLAQNAYLRLTLSVLFVGTPVFFAASCFALRFKVREAVDLAFGWNLIGAVVGGLLEFFSMSMGLRALLLVAVCAYLGAFFLKGKEGGREGGRAMVVPEPG